MTFGIKKIIVGLIGAAAGFLATEATEKGLWALDGKFWKDEDGTDTVDNEETEETEE